jgi:geranylgeranyl pyrophosphate synthase
MLLSSQAVGGKAADCLHAEVAVEILHTFTLVHDDIMDHDDTRRGRPTVHKKWDEATAILAGDGLVAKAYQTLLMTKSPRLLSILRIFTDGLLVLCEGQALDKAFETEEKITMDEYKEMIEKKTAKLMEISCEIGALLGNGSDKETTALKEFGHQLGIAFQIQDDILDLCSEESVTGKPVGSDLIQKKKTYLTIHFMNNASLSDREEYTKIIKNEPLTEKAIGHIRTLFENTGTIRSAQEVLEGYITKASEHLNGLMQNQARDDLEKLIKEIQHRIH